METWLELGENLSLIKFKPTRSNSRQVGGKIAWVADLSLETRLVAKRIDSQLHRSCELGSSWLELGGSLGVVVWRLQCQLLTEIKQKHSHYSYVSRSTTRETREAVFTCFSCKSSSCNQDVRHH